MNYAKRESEISNHKKGTNSTWLVRIFLASNYSIIPSPGCLGINKMNLLEPPGYIVLSLLLAR